jgi:hypothetical protein
MILPTIAFSQIRAHPNSQNDGFEELCCQLASLEPREPGAVFYRKGRGGDAGVECFVRFPDGRETGWQAKYVPGWSASLARQLDESIETALKKHPRLSIFIVCLPFDLPDSRAGRGKSPLEQWEDWLAKWHCKSQQRAYGLTIQQWSKSALCERLARDDPRYAGRLFYWFEQRCLDLEWFRHQFDKARVGLGSRYTPETNVETPIRRDFMAFAREHGLNEDAEQWSTNIQTTGHQAVRALKDAGSNADDGHATLVAAAVSQFAAGLECLPVPPEQPFPVNVWRCAADRGLQAARDALRWTYSLPPGKPDKSGSTPARWAQRELQELCTFFSRIVDALASQRWALANARWVLLYGTAGVGKSHLLADVVEDQVVHGYPALLILGSTLIEGDPWRQIIDGLDLPGMQVSTFLAALDSAAQASKVRAIVCIDV